MWFVGVLYFVSTTVNPILYNVMSRKYRQAFMMTLCNACMDDATRQRLQRDVFGGFTVYYSTAGRVSANRLSVVDEATPTRRRTVIVERGSEPGTITSSSSFGNRAFLSAAAGAPFHNGRVNIAADAERRRIRLLASDVAVADEQSRRQLMDKHLSLPYRQTSATRIRGDNGLNLAENEESSPDNQ